MIDRNLMAPFTAEELDRLGLDRQGDTLIAFDLKDLFAADATGKTHAVALSVGPLPSPKIENLIFAAPFMYQQYGRLYKIAEAMLSACEQLNAEYQKIGYPAGAFGTLAFERTLTDLQDRILEARRCAVVGPLQLAEEIKRQGLTQRKPK